MKCLKLLIIITLLISPFVLADPPSDGTIDNKSPNIVSFNVYTDIGLVFDATIFDANGGADLNYAKIEVHQTDSLSSPVVCWFETPTNLTLSIGGVYLQYGLIFKRLTPGQAKLILTGWHIYELNTTDDNGNWDTETALHYMAGEPHYINLNPQGSYIHRSDNNPAPEQVVMFTVYQWAYELQNIRVLIAERLYRQRALDTWRFIPTRRPTWDICLADAYYIINRWFKR